MAFIASRSVWGLVAGAIVLAGLPAVGLADADLSFLYLIFFWVALSTSWGILSGYAGYWSFGHAAFYGVGVYTTATLTTRLGVPFLATIPAAAALAALLALGIGLVVFRSAKLRGEFFALLTLSVSYVLATIVSNTPLDNGAGVNLGAVALPDLAGSAPATLYMLGLALAFSALLISCLTANSAFGMGLAAIHDDEDAAEVKGVPTRNFKLAAFALSSAIAGAVGAVQAVYVGYVTVGETFSINVPLYVVLMSILGGARRWMGPAAGAILITTALNLFTGSGQAELGRAGVALALVVVILVLPEGIVPALDRAMARLPFRQPLRRRMPSAAAGAEIPIAAATKGALLLDCRDVVKSFGGIKALRGVTLEVRAGEILALVGPNGSGKSTLINTISGHFPATSGSIAFDGRPIGTLEPHRVACAGVARTYQIPRLFDRMSAIDNVALCAVFTRGLSRRDARVEALRWLAITGLSARADRFPPHLNLHERKFLEFARALAARPRLLLLDEVLCGLTPTEVDSAILLIRRIRDAGTTIVFVEHLMRVVVALSDRVAVLDQGRLIALGAPGETMRDPRVVSVYLGKAHAA